MFDLGGHGEGHGNDLALDGFIKPPGSLDCVDPDTRRRGNGENLHAFEHGAPEAGKLADDEGIAFVKFLEDGCNPAFAPWRAEGDQNGKRFGNRKVKLAMPNKKQLRAYVDEYVTRRSYVTSRRQTLKKLTSILINEPYRISVTYRQNSPGSWGKHPSYIAAYSTYEESDIYVTERQSTTAL